MDKIIGIGGAGSSIAAKFSQYSQYDVYRLDSTGDSTLSYQIKKQNSPEDYEKHTPDLSDLFKDIDGDILFILGGGGKISGASLKILSQLKHCNINILYVCPDLAGLNNVSYLQNRLTFNVFQEYARSGIFNKIFLFDNSRIENLVGDVPLLQLRSKMNDIIVNAIHYYNIFSHTEPVLDNLEPPQDTNRIASFGIYDIKNSSEAPLFQLDGTRDKCYYYCINEDVINSDGRLLKTVKEQVLKETVKSSYQIHSTKHTDSFCYTVGYTNQIQALDKS